MRGLLVAGLILGSCRAAPPAPAVTTAGPSGLHAVVLSLDKLK